MISQTYLIWSHHRTYFARKRYFTLLLLSNTLCYHEPPDSHVLIVMVWWRKRRTLAPVLAVVYQTLSLASAMSPDPPAPHGVAPTLAALGCLPADPLSPLLSTEPTSTGRSAAWSCNLSCTGIATKPPTSGTCSKIRSVEAVRFESIKFKSRS